MTFAQKHQHHVNDYPTYPVKYVSYKDIAYDQQFKISWVGSYSGKYGQQPYVDLVPVNEGDCYMRVRLPKYTLDEIDQISHDSEDMEEIKAGHVGIKLRTYQTKSGSTTASITWVDM